MPPRKRPLDTARVVSDIDPVRPPPKRRPRNTAATSRGTTAAMAPPRHSLAALPYHVLASILAQLPPSTPPAFLLACATLCRALHDPAIAALYHSPPTAPLARAHRLLATLRARPALGVKVRALDIEVEPLLTAKFAGSPWDLADFLRLCTGLRHLRFVVLPALRYQPRWRYPDALWAALEAASSAARLHTWRWDRGLVPDALDYTDLRAITARCFTALRALEMHGFGADDDDDDDDAAGDGDQGRDDAGDEQEAQHLAAMLALMPRLADLTLTDCAAATPRLLTLLSLSAPAPNFATLTFTTCRALTAPALATLLASRACRALRALAVNRCPRCSLTFTAALPAALQHLAFDGQGATAPLLPLATATAPAWPPRLQTLCATSLRRWSSSECERFLASLVAAVPRMRGLRVLRVWCMLTDMDWRERSAFRERWMGEVRAVFEGRGCRAEVRFDDARPAGVLWGEGDFVEKVGGKSGGRVVVVEDVVSEGDEDYVDD
ncbi:hypothetical protein DFP73DRAFT_596517 [Morchella snyderi]|nr:hypothetical protein DFP73DRAFT_596517 [Morchella snyderi]